VKHTIIEGHELIRLMVALTSTDVYRLRIMEREDGVAIKINEGAWSPTIGTKEN
jgi:hypothetical protein